MTVSIPDAYADIKEGIVSGSPAGLYVIRAGSTVSVWPTSAGTATVYYTMCNPTKAEADITNNNFSTGQAEWYPWTAGAVSVATNMAMTSHVTCVACVASSGTWELEVVR